MSFLFYAFCLLISPGVVLYFLYNSIRECEVEYFFIEMFLFTLAAMLSLIIYGTAIFFAIDWTKDKLTK